MLIGAVGLPALIGAALGLKAPVGLLGLRVRGPLRVMVFPVVFVTKTPRNTIYLPLYLDGLLAKSTKSTTNWAWELENKEKAKIINAYLISMVLRLRSQYVCQDLFLENINSIYFCLQLHNEEHNTPLKPI